jgi:DNA-binding winged helix-turn-helix (wHTH) protein
LRYLFEDYILDTERRELSRGASALAVEPQVFDLLAFLIENRERVVSKDDLLAAVWEGRIVSESTMSSAINAARTAIGDSGEDQRLIRTFPRKGFRFAAPVREEQPSVAPAAGATGSSAASTVAPEPHRIPLVEPDAQTPGPRRAVTPTVLVLSVGAVAGVAVALGYLLWFPSSGTVRPAQRFDAAVVPLVEDETRRTLASYPSRPDAKALAITGGGFAVADGHRNAEAAKQDALQRCKARSTRDCRLYAVGMDVVWSKDAMPMAAPEDLRYEPLDLPLVPNEIPTIDRERKEFLARVHVNAPNHRAVALATRGAWPTSGRGTRAEAARLAVERCAESFQRPCLLLSIDGLLTLQIPKSRPIIRIFLPSTEAELPATDKERISKIYQGSEWRALARGKSGWHAIAGAPSEAAAVEAALKACAEADSDCRLHAIGNFAVAGQ